MTKVLTYPCPTCKKPSAWHDSPTKPFCSKRCQLIDLGEWASENYKIASDQSPFSDEMTATDALSKD
ncbi:DNA gyrase inhibitor YacG [Moraxella nasibovis]|uniref:DNA gyrase inhibitor YacG n=1 Tax=Moraxella nasibovis TaxID=2904120 RepID=UPI002410861A|nr:DNA gyrase inhibitor YacG [Moraxella nasibovis]WFF37855.1 DNA gyrase inhibitor YacG [Moraxella nasibovis]